VSYTGGVDRCPKAEADHHCAKDDLKKKVKQRTLHLLQQHDYRDLMARIVQAQLNPPAPLREDKAQTGSNLSDADIIRQAHEKVTSYKSHVLAAEVLAQVPCGPTKAPRTKENLKVRLSEFTLGKMRKEQALRWARRFLFGFGLVDEDPDVVTTPSTSSHGIDPTDRKHTSRKRAGSDLDLAGYTGDPAKRRRTSTGKVPMTKATANDEEALDEDQLQRAIAMSLVDNVPAASNTLSGVGSSCMTPDGGSDENKNKKGHGTEADSDDEDELSYADLKAKTAKAKAIYAALETKANAKKKEEKKKLAQQKAQADAEAAAAMAKAAEARERAKAAADQMQEMLSDSDADSD